MEGAYNTGLWTAAILFVPLSVWVIYASAIRGPYSGKVVGAAYAAGALTSFFLFVGYGFFKAGVIGSGGLLVFAAVIGFAPIILAAIASRLFKAALLRPFRRNRTKALASAPRPSTTFRDHSETASKPAAKVDALHPGSPSAWV